MMRQRQSHDALKPWGVTWVNWLAARGYATTDVVSITFNVGSPGTKLKESFAAGIGQVWIDKVPKGTVVQVDCVITMPIPAGMAAAVTDTYSFQVEGT